MTTHLLDANALIALVLADHEHHDRVASWSATVDRMALSPIVEGALMRFLVRRGQSPASGSEILTRLYAGTRFVFLPDALTYRDAELGHVVGHRQVTDAYLAALAAHHEARLATLDRALARGLPRHVLLIP